MARERIKAFATITVGGNSRLDAEKRRGTYGPRGPIEEKKSSEESAALAGPASPSKKNTAKRI